MDQEVKYIPISKLVLWSENPRDPIDVNATDQEIVDRALNDKNSKWTLSKLAKEMGDYYDQSELPTVVYHKGKPIVYDGNRRIILGKIKHGYAKVDSEEDLILPEFPKDIPCNVCTKPIALKNVLRKHGDSGSWSPLDRDIFLHKFMKQPKSVFLKLEECTGLISNNPVLNQGFVKKEIFSQHKLTEMGFDFEDDLIVSKHSNQEAKAILENISNLVSLESITTRKNRGQIISLLDKSNRLVIENNKNNSPKLNKIHFKLQPKPEAPRHTRRTKTHELEIFGAKLSLVPGEVSNLYRDIVDLHNFYASNKKNLSASFPGLIRMALRLLCEAAAEDNGSNIGKYLQDNFAKAKKELNQDNKTTLSTQNVTENTILQLVQIGAHKYQAAKNFDQTIAISIIIGSILTLSHGKK